MPCVSRHFRRSYLKANRPKVSKSEETRKVEYAYNVDINKLGVQELRCMRPMAL